MRDSQRGNRVPLKLNLEAVEPRVVLSAQPTGEIRLDGFFENAALDGVDFAIDPFISNGNSWTGLSDVRTDYGFTGRGQTVAVIDSGIAWDHSALGAGFGAGYRVVGGWDFTESDGNPYDDGPAGAHGTHVAGIIGSTNTLYSGVAPGVDLVSLRVFNDQGTGYFSWVEQALQWVHQNRNSFANPITTVNLSLGAAGNDNSPPSWAMLEDEFAQLVADGIFISVAAGNSFTTYNAAGLSYPGSSSYVVPVAAADDSGALSYFSQRNNRVIVAPGRSVMSTVPDYVGNLNGLPDDFARMSGTSMAAPYVAGASTLLREAFAFGGNFSVNEADLYNWMRNTADTIYDAATNQNYLRLNLDRAISSIMPGDDYGSTAGAAHGLGNIAQSRSFTGTIGSRADRDYFSFTAGGSGRIGFQLAGTHYLDATWELVGAGGSWDAASSTFSFDVVAGQSYTIGLGTQAGVGHYSVTATLAGTNVVDLGVIEAATFAGQSIAANNNYFSLTASRDRFLTVDASFLSSAGNIDLRLYNSSGALVGASSGAGNYERIDVFARSGDRFYLEVMGANADVDLRVTNLVAQNDGTVYVYGASSNDLIDFSAGAMHQVIVNGVSYSFNPAQFHRFQFYGGSGVDTVVLRGTAGADGADVRVGSAEMSGAGYMVQAFGFEAITVDARGGWDRAMVYDTAGNDTVIGSPTETRIYGAGYENRIFGVEQVQVVASTGTDVALLYDSPGDDTFLSWPTAARLYGEGWEVVARNFDAVRGMASTGYDRAFLYDSSGDDLLVSRPVDVRLRGAGFDNAVRDFDVVRAFSSGGFDRAQMFDSAGDDTMTAHSLDTRLRGANYDTAVRDFRQIEVFFSGGYDIANFYDSLLNDEFHADGSRAQLSAAAYTILAYGLDEVGAISAAGGTDRLYVSATDYLFHSLGNWA